MGSAIQAVLEAVLSPFLVSLGPGLVFANPLLHLGRGSPPALASGLRPAAPTEDAVTHGPGLGPDHLQPIFTVAVFFLLSTLIHPGAVSSSIPVRKA